MKLKLFILITMTLFITFSLAGAELPVIIISETASGNTLTQTVNIFTNGTADTNATTGCTGSQVLFGNGSCGVVAGTGDITSVEGDAYITNGSGSDDVNLVFNQTLLNETIDDRSANETNRFSNLTAYDCQGTDKVVGVFANGTIECGADTATASNIFDQDLNTTDDVTFANLTITTNTTSGFFNGLFNWTIETLSDIYLVFNGNELFFNETRLNDTINDLAVAGANETNRFQNLTTYNCQAENVFTGVALNGTGNCTSVEFNFNQSNIEFNFNQSDIEFNFNQSDIEFNFNQSNIEFNFNQSIANETNRLQNLTTYACQGTNKVSSIALNGTIICTADEGSGGNPFDQVLNTTSNVTFGNLNITRQVFINGTLNIQHESNATSEHALEVNGSVVFDHQATFDNDHALEILVSAGGFGDVKGLFIDFDSGAIVEGQDEEAIFINIDNTDSTGGDIAGLEIVTTNGSAEVHGYTVGVQVHPVEQLSGIFADMDSALNNTIDVLAAFIDSAIDTPIFTDNGDTVTLGNDVEFESMEFILSTMAGGAGIQPDFYFSTGVDTWTEFTPADGTDGMRDTGVILWELEDIPTWAVGTGTEFLIRINRTQGGLGTTPIASFVQIASATLYFWDINGFISVNNLSLEDFLIVGTGNANATGLSTGDVNISGTYYGDGSGITGITGVTDTYQNNVTNGFSDTLTAITDSTFNLGAIATRWLNGFFDFLTTERINADHGNFTNINATDWTNVTIDESQISDLTHTGNPFDQALNTTSNVTFIDVNLTGNLTIETQDNGICFGSACNASLYWNGTDIRITVT